MSSLLLNGSHNDSEQDAAAWVGQAGLYRTRLEALQNGEQQIEPVSTDRLIELARSHMREGHSYAQPRKEKHS
jgi:hypothetical protein